MLNRLSLALVLATSAVACVDSSTGSDPATPDSVTADLALANGGNTTADEQPEFGIPEAFEAAAIESDNANTDPLANDPTIVALDGSASPVGPTAGSGSASPPLALARDVIVVWGHIPGGAGGVARDWSGSLTASRGALVVKRTIAFEDNDHLLPRTAIDAVAFDSHTKPFVDGLALHVLDGAPTSAAAQTLVYQSATDATITYSIDLALLDAGPVVIDAGNGDKMVAIAQRTAVAGCDGGFMRGRWHSLVPGLGLGEYLGVVTARDGSVIGNVRGIYGTKKDGTPVVYGKFIDLAGKFVGIIAGTFDASDDEYAGKWLDKAGEHGLVHGHYFESADEQGGAFLGRWAQTACTQDPPAAASN